MLDHQDTPDLILECDCGTVHALYAAPGKTPNLADYAPCECGRAMGDDLDADFGPLAPLVAGMRDALDAAALALACAECLAEACTTPCAWCAAVRAEMPGAFGTESQAIEDVAL